MAKDPKQKSVLYIDSQPIARPGRVPSYLTSEQWRYASAEPTNTAYQTHLMRALKLEYKFAAKKGEDPKSSKIKEIIDYYKELFEKCSWDLTKVAWEKDSYDLPFGGALEIGWWPDTAFGGKFPAGYPAWFVHVDAGTMWINLGNPNYPYAQIDPNNNQRAISFKRREIARLMYLPHTSLKLRGYQRSPTEQNYQILDALSKLYTYDLKSLSDTPIAGILDLMDFSEADATEWAKGFKEMMMGVDPIKIPILYEHEKEAKFVQFGKSDIDVKEKWKHYAEKCGNPYGLSIGSLGLYEHDRTLAGARIQRITTQRTGIGGFAYDEKRAINRQFFPPDCPIMFDWDVPEIEDVVKRRQAEGLRIAYLGQMVQAGSLAPEDMLEQSVEDGIFTIPVKPGAIQEGIQGPPKPPAQKEVPPKAQKPKGEYPEYPPAMKAAHIVEETLLLKQDVGDDLEQTKAYKMMQEALVDQLYGKKVKGSIESIFNQLSEVQKGGPGSGHRSHKGRKGKRGGSAPRGGALQFKPVPVGQRGVFGGGYGGQMPARATYGSHPPTNSTLNGLDTRSFSSEERRYIADSVRNIPQKHLDMVRSFRQGDLGDRLGGECSVDGHIVMNKTSRGAMYDSATVVHEIGHAVMYHNGGRVSSHGKRFKEIYKEKAKGVRETTRELAAMARSPFAHPVKGFPSGYSMFNHEELFAESYRMYVKSPGELNKRAPDVYQYMRDEVFGGIEY